MFTTAINVDYLALFLIFMYSILEVLLLRTVESYRSAEIEEESEDEEEEEEQEQDYDDEHLIISPRDSVFNLIDREEDHSQDDSEEEFDDGEEEYEEGDAWTPVEMTTPRVSRSVFHDRVVNSSGKQENGGDDGRREELNRGEIDGLFCPICFEAWTSSGSHQICCLPCGHIYGLSCINRWLQSSLKCPQCNGLCILKDVRKLYVSRLCVADEELHKSVLSLKEAKSANIEQKAAPLTVEELIDQIRSNPILMQSLATAFSDLYQHQVFTP